MCLLFLCEALFLDEHFWESNFSKHRTALKHFFEQKKCILESAGLHTSLCVPAACH